MTAAVRRKHQSRVCECARGISPQLSCPWFPPDFPSRPSAASRAPTPPHSAVLLSQTLLVQGSYGLRLCVLIHRQVLNLMKSRQPVCSSVLGTLLPSLATSVGLFRAAPCQNIGSSRSTCPPGQKCQPMQMQQPGRDPSTRPQRVSRTNYHAESCQPILLANVFCHGSSSKVKL